MKKRLRNTDMNCQITISGRKLQMVLIQGKFVRKKNTIQKALLAMGQFQNMDNEENPKTRWECPENDNERQ